MIPFSFAYYRPDTIDEALQAYQQLTAAGKRPLYYSGGTEIITLGRVNKLYTGAVIDLKGVPECRVLECNNGQLVVGAAVPVTEAVEANSFPLLTVGAGRIADHTSRCTITIGGNICGSFVYREAVLPFLVAESQVVIAGPQGVRTEPIMEAFRKKLHLHAGEFLVQVLTDLRMTELPYWAIKKTRQSFINYPLVSLASLRRGAQIRVAISGLLDYPFRSPAVEQELNACELSVEQRIDQAVSRLPDKIVTDVEGTSAYREFVFRGLLRQVLDELEEG